MDSNFIFSEIDKDIANGVYEAGSLATRFPPEPNGYLHIGHAKAVFINFSVKEKYGARTNLRFDDTNPSKEDTEYAQAIMRDVAWLGYRWDGIFYASDYFDRMYAYAHELISKGLAFVDEQTPEEIRLTRGTLTQKGAESPFRNRPREESARLFSEMRDGLHPAASMVLRARIDMSSPNINMRDPVIYRILFERHHNTGDAWVIYPMYDYAHPIEDAIEGITHSLCSMEFEDHRPFYDWVLSNLDDYAARRPRQIEFARLNFPNTLTSKRYVKELVESGIVDGWDDPRLATLSGMRRRGITPAAIRAFCEVTGVSRANSTVELSQLEHFVREDLQKISKKVMAVVDPLRLTLTNYPEGGIEQLDVPYDNSDPEAGSRRVPFSANLYIERSDFMVTPPPKYRRLTAGAEVRLIGAYLVTATGYETDGEGRVTRVLATYDPLTKSGAGSQTRKVKGTIHWVCADECVPVECREFSDVYTDGEGSFMDKVHPDSLTVKSSFAEASLKDVAAFDRFQFLRQGFFCADERYSTPEKPVFNKTVGLKSGWTPGNE